MSATLKKGEKYTGKIVRIAFPNKGYAECIHEGEKFEVIVKGTIPGQVVEFVISKKKNGRYEGRLIQVVEKSEFETNENICPYESVCGGCSYQKLSYENQLKIKGEMVKNIIDAVCKDYTYEGIIGSPKQMAYRNKMEFSFGDEIKGGALALGLHKKGSFYDIVTVDGCRIVHEDYSKVLKATLDFFASKNVEYYHKMRHEGVLRHLLVRRSERTKELLVDLVTTSSMDESLCEEWANIIKNLDIEATIKGILHTVNDSLADVVQSDRTDILYGDDYIYEEILGLKFKISVFSFFQTNSLGAEILYSKAREYAGETANKVIFDLYSGTGTIAQMLAPVASKVVGIEIIEEAVHAARVNAELNGLNNCEFIAGDVLKELDNVTEKPELIILDPPRDGIHPKALDKIIAYGVDNIVYISCKPTSLARDLEVLMEGGYKVVKVAAVDMFPNTTHVETVACLTRK